MYSGIIICLLLSQSEPDFVELHSFVKELQGIARPHSLYSPTSALKAKRTEELLAAFADLHNTVDLRLDSTVVEISWKDGVGKIELAPMLKRWKQGGSDMPLRLSENPTLDVIMPKEVASAVLKKDRVIIEAHCVRLLTGVADSGAPHGQFLFSASSKRFGVSIGSFVTTDYTVTLLRHGTCKGYWEASAIDDPNKKKSVESNF